jgi:ABC-type branched-subunit amino acid transport system ATPase component/ABC-type branched-subunit amino acid transport system permease subunit
VNPLVAAVRERRPTSSQLRAVGLWVAGLAVGLALAKVTEFDTPLPVVVLGAIIGTTYGLLAVGLVLVYRSNRIVNFAHGEVGAFASAMFGLLFVKTGLNYYVLLPVGLAIGAGAGTLAEVGDVRRLRKAPKLMSIVATLGIGQFLVLLALVFNTQAGSSGAFPQPAGMPTFTVGKLVLTPAYTAILAFSPVTVLLLALFLKYSKYGLAIRSSAANPEAARMAGIPAARMSALAWGIAGSLSAMTAILTQPTRGFTSGETFGPSLLLRALAAAVLARMNSLPLALAGGVAMGVIEQLMLWNQPNAGLVELVLFFIILATLLLQKQRGGREEEKGSWAAVQALRPVPEALQKLWAVRNLGVVMGSAAFAVAALLPFFITNATSTTLITIMSFALIGLSVSIITGLGGQLSLGQFAIAGVGAWASYAVSTRIGHFELAFLYAGFAGALASLVIGLPALRIRGLFLTVTTLSFALVMPAYLLPRPWVLGNGVDPGRPILGDTALITGRQYYWFALPVLALATLLARNIRQGGFGRLLIAVRDNEEAARSFTVRASVVKIQGFLLAGFLAGVGGALYGHGFAIISHETFPTKYSIAIVAMAVIGGISLLSGPFLGALFVLGIPAFLPLDAAGLAASALGQLLVIMYLPAGLGGMVEPLRDRIVKHLGRRAGLDVDAIYGEVAAAAGSVGAARRTRQLPVPAGERLRPPGTVLLDVRNLVKSFGGVHAVRGVSFDVRSGETLGLIGPNGAGKTTTFELLGGFTKADGGLVRFEGQDITRLGPEARGRLGLIRSFQDAGLFPTLTVRETIRLALEKEYPTPFFSSVLGLRPNERAKDALVDDLLDFMGLGAYRSSQIQQLSTGTRRITEIACLVALRPTLLLLDEPSSGVAQKETEALGVLLSELRRELKLTMVIIEHDIPMVMSLSDRIVAMADGEVIAYGTPAEVRNSPAVVEAYLGGSITAIERSGAAIPATVPAQTSGLDSWPDVPGLGPARRDALIQAFGTVEAVRAASLEDLSRVPGVGKATALRILDTLR